MSTVTKAIVDPTIDNTLNEVNLKHPVLYTVFQTNTLIEADKSEFNHTTEIKFYNSILNHNHIKDPSLEYIIPFEDIFSVSENQLARDVKKFTDRVMKRVIHIDENVMKEMFDENVRASIVPFPTIKFDARNKEFRVTINKYFKGILSEAMSIGFTKGDYDQIQGLNKNMNLLYWYLRRLQKTRKIWIKDIEEMRSSMNLKAYKDFRNFRKHILDKGKEAFEGTWTEFDWKTSRTSGKGGKIIAIEITFKQGPYEENSSPAGYGEPWEKDLLNMGINKNIIIKFREKANSQIKEFGDYIGKDFVWSNGYITYSLEACRKEWKIKKTQGQEIANYTAWFYSGLMKGQWNKYVESQPALFTDTFGVSAIKPQENSQEK